MRAARHYNVNGLAGCAQQTRSRKLGTLVGVYHCGQAGLENDPDARWAVVCEEHSTIATHSSLARAREFAPDPSLWCDDCREALEAKKAQS